MVLLVLLVLLPEEVLSLPQTGRLMHLSPPAVQQGRYLHQQLGLLI